MMDRRFLWELMVLALLVTGCVQESLSGTDYVPNYYIVGTLTDRPEKITVRLLRNQPVEETSALNGVEGAVLRLYTETENGTDSLITENFIYQRALYTSVEEIGGTTGSSYWIEITLPDGTFLTSKKEIMPSQIPIESYETVDNGDGNSVNVLLEFQDPEGRNLYRVTDSPAPYEDVTVSGPIGDYDWGLYFDTLFDGQRARLNYGPVPVTLYDTEVSLFHLSLSSYEYFNQVERQTDPFDESLGERIVGNGFFGTPSLPIIGNIAFEDETPAYGNFNVYSASSITLPRQ